MMRAGLAPTSAMSAKVTSSASAPSSSRRRAIFAALTTTRIGSPPATASRIQGSVPSRKPAVPCVEQGLVTEPVRRPVLDVFCGRCHRVPRGRRGLPAESLDASAPTFGRRGPVRRRARRSARVKRSETPSGSKAVNRGGEAFHERPGRPWTTSESIAPSRRLARRVTTSSAPTARPSWTSGAREGARTAPPGPSKPSTCAAQPGAPGPARAAGRALGQRLARGQPGLGHRDRWSGSSAVAQEERGVVDLEHVGDSAQLDRREVLEARSGAESPASRRAPARVRAPCRCHPRGHATRP